MVETKFEETSSSLVESAVESILENKTAFEPIRESVTVSSLYAACLGQI